MAVSSVPMALRFSSRELCEFQLRVMYPKVPCNSGDQIEIKVLSCLKHSNIFLTKIYFFPPLTPWNDEFAFKTKEKEKQRNIRGIREKVPLEINCKCVLQCNTQAIRKQLKFSSSGDNLIVTLLMYSPNFSRSSGHNAR